MNRKDTAVTGMKYRTKHSKPLRHKLLVASSFPITKTNIFNGKEFVRVAKCQHEILFTLLDDINLSVTLD